jgi:excisionase family DNA binding protein
MKLSDLFAHKINESEDENANTKDAPEPGGTGEFITVKQAAKELGVSPARVRQFIMDGRLSTHEPEVGRRDNLLKKSEVERFGKKERKITGRPEEGSKKDKKED